MIDTDDGYIKLVCDNDGATFDIKSNNYKATKKAAKKSGWLSDKYGFLCPKCKRKFKINNMKEFRNGK